MAEHFFSKHISNDLQELPLIAEEVELFGVQADWSAAIIMQINLVIEELVVNTINYGYTNARTGQIQITINSNSLDITLEITDDGKAYNPLENTLPDTSLDIENRPIGGLGIFLVKNYMDTFEYAYIEGKNCLTLSKKL